MGQLTRILWIDDNRGAIERLADELENMDLSYEVYTEVNPDKALNRLLQNQEPFDVVITDQIFPNSSISGLQIASLVHQHDLNTCCILITGEAQNFPQIYQSINSDILFTFFEKPVTSHEISFAVRKYLSEREYERKLSLIQEIDVAATQAFDLTTVLNHLVQRVSDIMGWPVCSIILRDGDKLRIATDVSYDTEMKMQFDLKIGQGFSGYSIKHAEVINVSDVSKPYFSENGQEVNHAYPDYFTKSNLFSMLTVPIEYHEMTIGCINAHKHGKQGFTEEEAQLLGIIASRAAISIQAADNFQKIIKALNGIGRRINSIKDEREILDTIVPETEAILNARRGCILLLDEKKQKLICRTVNCLFARDNSDTCTFSVSNLKRNDGKKNLVAEVYQSNMGKYIDIVEEGYFVTESRDRSSDLPSKYQMAVPLFHEMDKNVIGVLSVERIERDFPFNSQDLEVFHALANFIVTVIDKNQLYNNEKRKTQILSILAKIAARIQNEDNLIRMLHRILTGITVKEGLRFNRAAFFMFDDMKGLFKGVIGIGELTRADAEKTWRELEEAGKGFEDIIADADSLPTNELVTTPISSKISEIRIEFPKTHVLFNHTNCLVSNDNHITQHKFTKISGIFKSSHFLAAPIFVGNRPWGFIYLDKCYLKNNSITNEDRQLLTNFLYQIEEALQNFYNRRRSNVLARIGEVVNSNLEEREIYDRVVEIIVGTFDADSGLLFKRNLAVDRPYIMDHKDFGLEFKENEGFVGWIVSNKKPIRTKIEKKNGTYCDDTGEIKWSIRKVSPEDFPFFLGIPIKIEGEKEIEAALCLRRAKSSVKFTCHEERLLMEVGTLLSIAIKKAKLLEQKDKLIKQKGEWIDVINHLSKLNLTSGKSALKHVLRDIYKISLNISGQEYGQLFLYDKDEDLLKIKYSKAFNRDALKIDEGIVGICARERKIVNISDVTKEPWCHHYIPINSKVRSRSDIAIPILYKTGKKDELIGVINIESPEKSAFHGDLVLMLQTLANNAGIAIMNAQLMQQLKKQIQSVKKYRDVASAVVSQQSLQEIYTKIADVTYSLNKKRATKIGVNLCFPDEARKNLMIKGTAGSVSDDFSLEPIPISHSFTGDVYKKRKSRRVGDVSRLKKYQKSNHFDFTTKSELAVPILYGEQILGVLNAEASTYYAFTREEEETFKFFADLTGIAIQASRVFEEMNDYLDAIAHKLKNRLHTFSTGIEDLAESQQDFNQETVEILLREIEEYKMDIENLSLLSKLGTSDARWKLEEFSIPNLVKNLDFSYNRSLKAKDLKLNIIDKSDNVKILSIKNALENILDNLLSNAINFSCEGTSIDVEITSLKPDIFISMTNYGVGIKNDEIPKIFEKYYYRYAPANIKQISPASGLGLYLVKRLVGLIGGEIHVDSEVSKFAKFTVKLPLEIKGDFYA